MFSDELYSLDTNAAVSFEGAGQFPIIRLDFSQVEFLVTTLSDAFYNEPQFRYLFPDQEMGRKVLSWFFRFIGRSGQVSGEIYTTRNIEGGAVWISRGDAFPFERLIRKGIRATPFKLGSSFRRCINLSTRLQTVHQRLAMGPHWHLMAVGLKPSKLGNSIASALLQLLLSQADSDGLPCYLETFQERDIPFYEDFGFRVEGAGIIPGGELSFWAMMRLPQ